LEKNISIQIEFLFPFEGHIYSFILIKKKQILPKTLPFSLTIHLEKFPYSLFNFDRKYKMNIQLRLFLFFFVWTPLFISAQNLKEQETHIFHWGVLSDTIVYNESSFNSVMIKTNIETLKSVIEEPVFIMKNGKRIEIESFGLYVYNFRQNDLTEIFQIDRYQSRKAGKYHGSEKIGHLINEYSQVNLVKVKAKNGYTFNVSIQFEKNTNEYISHVKLPQVPKGEVFNFQVVSFENQKTILRIDTTNESKKHIREIYSNPEKYQIIHISDFKTTRRFISEEDLLDVKINPINVIENEKLAKLSFLNLPEFTDYSIENIPFIFQWGDLKNISYEIFRETEINQTENLFSPDDIIENLNRPFFINQGFQDFEIVKMRVSILQENGIPISFITDHFNYPKIQKAFENIKSETTIVYDEIFIKNKDGQTIFLPPAFSFIIE